MNRHLRIPSATGALFIAACLGPALHAASDAASLQARYISLSREFASANPGWTPDRPQTGNLLYVASDQYSPGQPIEERSRGFRNKYADALFELAKQAAEAGQASLAFQWATEAVYENPDYAVARHVLSYDERDGKWLTAYGAKMFDAGKVWNSARGWVAANEAKSNAAESASDAARHADIKHGWQLRTDHFLVTTNHSLAAGAELGARLERLYQVWRQLFAGFYLSDKELRGLFAGTSKPKLPVRPFRVFYYRDRDEYVAALRSRQSRIDETLGIYFDTYHEAHFFAGEKQDRATLYHEAVHQLFQESKPAAKRIGARANAWVIEGVATYFETLTEHPDPKAGLYYTIGELTKGRLVSARQRLREGFYIPLAELSRLGKDELQEPANIARRYSESCGLAAFLIDGAEGRFREPLVRYHQAIYAGHDNEQSLAEATGSSYSDLDAAYRKYMESLP